MYDFIDLMYVCGEGALNPVWSSGSGPSKAGHWGGCEVFESPGGLLNQSIPFTSLHVFSPIILEQSIFISIG